MLFENFVDMFSTVTLLKHGLVLVVGPPGTEKTCVVDHVARQSRAKGWSTRKSYNRLDKHQLSGNSCVVSVSTSRCGKITMGQINKTVFF